MANPAPTSLPSRSRNGTRLRIVATVILLLGIGAAGWVYATGAPPDDLSADPATARSSKTEARNIEINSGKMGVMMSNLLDDMKDPANQALVILLCTVLPAAGCFYFAHLLDRDPGPEPPPPPQNPP